MTTYYCPNPECAGTKLADHFNDNVWSCRKCDWLWDLNREIPYDVMPLTRDPTKPPSTAGWRRGVDGLPLREIAHNLGPGKNYDVGDMAMLKQENERLRNNLADVAKKHNDLVDRIKELEERDAFLTVANKRLEEGYPDPPCTHCTPCVECQILGLPDSLAKDNAQTLVKRLKEEDLPLPDDCFLEYVSNSIWVRWSDEGLGAQFYQNDVNNVVLGGKLCGDNWLGDILGELANRELVQEDAGSCFKDADGNYQHERRREKHLREPAGFGSKPWR